VAGGTGLGQQEGMNDEETGQRAGRTFARVAQHASREDGALLTHVARPDGMPTPIQHTLAQACWRGWRRQH